MSATPRGSVLPVDVFPVIFVTQAISQPKSSRRVVQVSPRGILSPPIKPNYHIRADGAFYVYYEFIRMLRTLLVVYVLPDELKHICRSHHALSLLLARYPQSEGASSTEMLGFSMVVVFLRIYSLSLHCLGCGRKNERRAQYRAKTCSPRLTKFSGLRGDNRCCLAT